MKPLWMSLLAFVACSLPALAAQQQPPAKAGPTLVDLIRKELSTNPGLQPSAGVQIEGATQTNGVITLTGKIGQESQREQIKAAIQKIKTEIQNTLDFKVTDIDLTGLVVSGAQPKLPQTGNDVPAIRVDCPTVRYYDCPTVRYYDCPTIRQSRVRICRCR